MLAGAVGLSWSRGTTIPAVSTILPFGVPWIGHQAQAFPAYTCKGPLFKRSGRQNVPSMAGIE